ncbi:hypothetical protein [Dyadobacter arcticus]|uniref:HTTM domain-containing protein n=1 Tax=Dyadobacter arcticus TaxID=1078754 RepID=A0ABX0UHL1_9BACT|nr:hypothetical protein [Dyadobacter arcticus]NIJ52407.1 hypothetical protein [Dyadobacter arcticus]
MRHINPFYLLEKAVCPELVLLVRLLAVYLLLTRESPFMGNQGTGRFYPILEFLAKIGTDSEFNQGIYVLFVCGIVILLFTSFVRLGSFITGAIFLIGMLSCQTCISVAHMFTACLFICTSLSNTVTGTELIRFQLIVLYLGADINKILDKDWWTGASMETLLAVKHQIPAYLAAADLFPPLFLSQCLGFGVIIFQAAIAILLINKRLIPYAMLGALLLHLPMVLLMQMTFGPFLAALILGYGSLLAWPKRLVYDSTVHSAWLVTILKFFDFNNQIEMAIEKGGPDSVKRWIRTVMGFLTHPAILLFLTGLSAVLIRYGKLLPLGIFIIFLFFTKVWIFRTPKKERQPTLATFP